MYQTVKLFDLANAPAEFREDGQFHPLQSRPGDLASQVLSVRVGDYTWSADEAEVGGQVHEVTFAEYLLHQWLLEQGASQGEMVFLTWWADTPASSVTRFDSRVAA